MRYRPPAEPTPKGRTMMKIIMIILVVLLICAAVAMVYRMIRLGKESQQMAGLEAVVQYDLKPCSDSPNCVSTSDDRERHYIAPISGGKREFDAVAAFIAENQSAQIRLLSENYLYAEYKTKLFGFVDDIEILLTSQGLEVRSASRVGYSDLDANRRRVEDLRARLENWRK